MMKTIYEWIKGVIDKMFKSDDLKILNSNINISDVMVAKLEAWQAILLGNAEWCRDDLESIRIEQGICQEFANVVTSEMKLSISDKQMDKDIQLALRNLNENLQDGIGLGSFIVRTVENKTEYLTPDKFIPIEWDVDGRLLDVYLVETFDVKDVRYYRFERHSLKSGYLTITNQAFKGTKAKIEATIPLQSIEKWANITEEIGYPKMNKLEIGYYRNPIKNKIDNSMMGVSIFDSAINLIKKADTQYGRLDWEYESAERALHVDDIALKGNKLPTGKKKLYRGLHNVAIGNDKDLFEEFSPALRDEAYIRGLNEYLRRIEFAVSLAYGDLSKAEQIEKTATEIITSKQKKYNMVNAIEANLETCLRDFIDGYAFYNSKFTSGYEVNITFKDSVLTSEDAERMQDVQDVNLGIMQKWEYRMKWYNEDEATAKKNVVQETEQGLEYGT